MFYACVHDNLNNYNINYSYKLENYDDAILFYNKAIDLIIEHKPDIRQDIKDYLEKMIGKYMREKGKQNR